MGNEIMSSQTQGLGSQAEKVRVMEEAGSGHTLGNAEASHAVGAHGGGAVSTERLGLWEEAKGGWECSLPHPGTPSPRPDPSEACGVPCNVHSSTGLDWGCPF